MKGSPSVIHTPQPGWAALLRQRALRDRRVPDLLATLNLYRGHDDYYRERIGNAREWTASRSKGSRSHYLVKGGSFAGTPGLLSTFDRKLLQRDVRDMKTGFRCCVPQEAE